MHNVQIKILLTLLLAMVLPCFAWIEAYPYSRAEKIAGRVLGVLVGAALLDLTWLVWAP